MVIDNVVGKLSEKRYQINLGGVIEVCLIKLKWMIHGYMGLSDLSLQLKIKLPSASILQTSPYNGNECRDSGQTKILRKSDSCRLTPKEDSLIKTSRLRKCKREYEVYKRQEIGWTAGNAILSVPSIPATGRNLNQWLMLALCPCKTIQGLKSHGQWRSREVLLLYQWTISLVVNHLWESEYDYLQLDIHKWTHLGSKG